MGSEYRLTRSELRVRENRAKGKILRAAEVERRGNKCELCPYNKYPEILQFHHTSPKDKRGDVSPMFILVAAGKLKKAVLEEELKKTILICPNCHSELHIIKKQ